MLDYKYSSFLSYLYSSNLQYKDHEAFIIRRRIKKEKVFYADLLSLLAKLEKFFGKEKIKKEEKFLLWGTNCPQYALLLLSCFTLGRIAVPIDYRTSEPTIESIIKKTSVKYAFVSKYLRFEFIKRKKIKIFFIEDLFDYLKEISKTRQIRQIIADKKYLNPEAICEIVFTSGTTGVPKGVVLTQKAILANLSSAAKSLPDLSGGRIISILPLSHMFEQIVGLLIPLGFGGTIYYLPRINSFRILQAFAEYKPTHQIFVPQILKIIWEKIEEQARKEGNFGKLQSILRIAPFLPIIFRRLIFHKIHKSFGGKLKLIACGGAPLDVTIGRNFINIGLPVIEGYGATEVTAVATFNPIDRIKLGSVGKAVDRVTITVDKNKEIYIASSAISSGYYQDQVKTRQSFTKQGFKTGDIGDFDKDGYLRIIGRDAFKIVLASGEKVFVEDIETQVKLDPRVEDVCVVAKRLPDGDLVHAFFILKNKVGDSLPKIVADVNQNLESKQQMTSFELWKENDFPRTYTLKIDRAYMVSYANKKKDEIEKMKLTQPGNYYDILDIVSKISGVVKERITDSDLLTTDLGLDSLSRVELVSLAEEYLGVILDETQINAKTTISNLKEMAKKAEVTEDVKIPTWQFSFWGQILHNLFIRLVLIPMHSIIINIIYPQKHQPQIEPGSIVIFNHPGVADVVCVVRFFARCGNLKFVTNITASAWEKKTPFTYWLELVAGGIPLYETGHRLYKILRFDWDLMDKGYNLLFAPQGRTQRSDEEDPFLPGIGYLMKQLDRPVYIIKIKGYREIWPAPAKNLVDCLLSELLPRKRGVVDLVVSKPIYRDWDKLSMHEIANFLEEKYKKL